MLSPDKEKGHLKFYPAVNWSSSSNHIPPGSIHCISLFLYSDAVCSSYDIPLSSIHCIGLFLYSNAVCSSYDIPLSSIHCMSLFLYSDAVCSSYHIPLSSIHCIGLFLYSNAVCSSCYIPLSSIHCIGLFLYSNAVCSSYHIPPSSSGYWYLRATCQGCLEPYTSPCLRHIDNEMNGSTELIQVNLTVQWNHIVSQSILCKLFMIGIHGLPVKVKYG